LSYARFKKSGRLGCATCYEVFEEKLHSILEEIHQSKQHLGKVPRSFGEEPGKAAELTRLHQRLKEAIDKEAFEEAAVLRDSIQSLKEAKKGPKTRK
jgi:protein arginine kinase activator